MKRRRLSIVLAVLLAILGTAGVLVYVRHANDRALAGQRAVTVLIAKRLIPSGTSAADAQQQGLLGSETLPAESVPADALTALTPDISALVTDAEVQPGQLLLRPMLVTAAQVTSGLAIPNGMVAISIMFCVPEAVAGFIHVGSQVAVFDTVASSSSNTSSNSSNSTLSAQAACGGPHQQQGGLTATTKLVLPQVMVLDIGPAPASSQSGGTATNGTSSSGNQGTELVTVAVSQQDAERLIQLTEDGLPYLALLNGSSTSVSTTGTSARGH
jgi:pilus assembly protein CpaB